MSVPSISSLDFHPYPRWPPLLLVTSPIPVPRQPEVLRKAKRFHLSAFGPSAAAGIATVTTSAPYPQASPNATLPLGLTPPPGPIPRPHPTPTLKGLQEGTTDDLPPPPPSSGSRFWGCANHTSKRRRKQGEPGWESLPTPCPLRTPCGNACPVRTGPLEGPKLPLGRRGPALFGKLSGQIRDCGTETAPDQASPRAHNPKISPFSSRTRAGQTFPSTLCSTPSTLSLAPSGVARAQGGRSHTGSRVGHQRRGRRA